MDLRLLSKLFLYKRPRVLKTLASGDCGHGVLNNMNQWIPSSEETFAQIGILLLLTQHVEQVTSCLIGIVYPSGIPSGEELEKLERNTLGSLTRTLKERVEMDPIFERLFDHFVEGRNLFVHRLSDQPGFDMGSENGRDKIWNFLEKYQTELQEISLVVTSALFKHFDATGMPETKWHQELRRTGFLQEIKQYESRSQAAFRRRRP